MVHLSLLWILYYINEQNPNLLTSLPHTHNLNPPQSHFSLPSSNDGDAGGASDVVLDCVRGLPTFFLAPLVGSTSGSPTGYGPTT